MNIPTTEEIINDPASSFWLKEAIGKCLERDPVDALNDAETLVAVLKTRLDSVVARSAE